MPIYTFRMKSTESFINETPGLKSSTDQTVVIVIVPVMKRQCS